MTRPRLTALTPLVLCLACVGITFSQTVSYDGHRVVRVWVGDESELDRLLKITEESWECHGPGIGQNDVRMTPEQFALLEVAHLPYEVLIDNLQAKIDAERAEIEAARQRGLTTPWDSYMDYATIQAYMNELIALRPDLASSFTLGTTVENRAILGLRVSAPGGGTKPMVFFHGGIHAREWITVPVSLYVADQLIRHYDTDPFIHELVDRCDFRIVPVLNVDGYLYTWGPNRLWRKNRRVNSDGSIGVDLNRNFGYQWGGEGASATPSNDTYRGPSAFSEPETQAVRDFMIAHPEIRAYCDIHSYSQLIMWAWGYQAALAPDNAVLDVIGTQMRNIVFSVHGMTYVDGPIYTTIYPASGTSVDYAYGGRGILAFTYELRDTGTNGFTLPASQILPNCEEIFPALMYYADFVTAALRISFPSGIPDHFEPNTATTMDVRIVNGTDTADTNNAALYYRTSPSGSFTAVPLLWLGGENYRATFPPRGCGPATEWYVAATSQQGRTAYAPTGAPAFTNDAPVGTLSISVNETFETAGSWTVINESVSTGGWTRVDPNGTTNAGQPAQPENDNTPSGTMCYVTGQGTVGGSASAADLDGGPTRLVSPVYDMSGLNDPRVSYYRWVYCSTGEDTMTVEISNNNGASWTTLEVAGHQNTWTYRSFRVSDFVTPTNLMRLRFSIADQPNNSVTEGAVDDVAIASFDCAASLLGDLNCDGVVDILDINPFTLALSDPTGYSLAYPNCDINNGDVNDDGNVDVLDINPFIALLSGP